MKFMKAMVMKEEYEIIWKFRDSYMSGCVLGEGDDDEFDGKNKPNLTGKILPQRSNIIPDIKFPAKFEIE